LQLVVARVGDRSQRLTPRPANGTRARTTRRPLQNAFGVAITKYSSASTRMVIDSLRTMVIWGFSLAVKWESFCWVQLIGFALLLAGSMIYNQVLRLPGLSYPESAAKAGALLDEEEDEEGVEYAAMGSGAAFAGGSGAYGKADI